MCLPFQANVYFQTLATRAREWKDTAEKDRVEKERLEGESRGWEARFYSEAKQHASTLLRVSELEKSKEDVIEEYMESPEFYTFLDEHDDDVIRSTTETTWSRALGAVLGKFPTLFSPEIDFPCPRLPGSAGASASQSAPEAWGPWPSRSPAPDDRTMQDLEGDEFDGGSSEP